MEAFFGGVFQMEAFYGGVFQMEAFYGGVFQMEASFGGVYQIGGVLVQVFFKCGRFTRGVWIVELLRVQYTRNTTTPVTTAIIDNGEAKGEPRWF